MQNALGQYIIQIEIGSGGARYKSKRNGDSANTLPAVLNQVAGETRRLQEIFRLIKSGSKFSL
jgi:hypothetical protein